MTAKTAVTDALERSYTLRPALNRRRGRGRRGRMPAVPRDKAGVREKEGKEEKEGQARGR